jgi:hypothetical protein
MLQGHSLAATLGTPQHPCSAGCHNHMALAGLKGDAVTTPRIPTQGGR